MLFAAVWQKEKNQIQAQELTVEYQGETQNTDQFLRRAQGARVFMLLAGTRPRSVRQGCARGAWAPRVARRASRVES